MAMVRSYAIRCIGITESKALKNPEVPDLVMVNISPLE